MKSNQMKNDGRVNERVYDFKSYTQQEATSRSRVYDYPDFELDYLENE